MADGGAWQTGVYDNGHNYPHEAQTDKYPSRNPSQPVGKPSPVPGVPAAMYNLPATGGSRDTGAVPIISIALRLATIVFSVIGFALVASNEGEGTSYCGYTSVCWSRWKALNSNNMRYLLAINVIVCVYSIVQLVISIVNSCTGKTVLSAPTTPASTITYTCDQVLAYMLIAGCGAGACVAINSKKGESGQLACREGFTIFCDKLAASVAMSCVAFLCIGLSALMAYFRVYKVAKV